MGTFFAEAVLASPARPERQVTERDAAEVLIDPVQRKLVPALQYGAATT